MYTPTSFKRDRTDVLKETKFLALGFAALLISRLESIPPAMAQQTKSKSSFAPLLDSLRDGISEPKTSNKQLMLQEFTLKSDSTARKYFLHVPPNYDPTKTTPLVLAFHGAGGHARAMPQLTNFNECADKHSFIIAYLEGLNTRWNEGTGGTSPAEMTDVAYTRAALSQIQANYKIDRTRIYAFGMSNGGFFSQFLAINMPGTLAAIASVAASIEESTYKNFKPTRPMSVLFIHGDDDDVVPYTGGSIGVERTLEEKASRRAMSARQAADYWATADSITAKPVTTKLPDSKPPDGTHVLKTSYSGGKHGTEVILLTVQNGGHTWPSGLQYLPEELVGKTTHAINASQEIWKFFERHQLTH